jgi:rubrerythrin
VRLNTCSEAISFARELENKSAGFYEDLSRRYSQEAELFLALAGENKKNIIQVERAYHGVISDALEGCFAFNLDADEYHIETDLAEGASLSDAVKKAVELEEKLIGFYSDAATHSEGLMADVPRAFRMVIKKREKRKPKLESLLS